MRQHLPLEFKLSLSDEFILVKVLKFVARHLTSGANANSEVIYRSLIRNYLSTVKKLIDDIIRKVFFYLQMKLCLQNNRSFQFL